MTRQLSLYPALLLLALIALPGCTSDKPAASTAKPSFFAYERHMATSEVMAIDAAAREITLREEGDEAQTYKIGDEVRNIEQVKVGDQVAVQYYEASSIMVLPPGAPVNSATQAVARAEPGQKPGGVASRQMTKTVTVASVFPKTSEVVTRNSAGKLRTWTVKDAKKLESIQSGDRVQLTYTELLAVRVSPAPPQPAPAAPAAAPAKP